MSLFIAAGSSGGIFSFSVRLAPNRISRIEALGRPVFGTLLSLFFKARCFLLCPLRVGAKGKDRIAEWIMRTGTRREDGSYKFLLI